MRVGEKQLKQLPLFSDDENVPPIRGSNCSVQVSFCLPECSAMLRKAGGCQGN